MKRLIHVFIITILIIFLILCKSPERPEIKKQAILEIAVQYEPIIFSYNNFHESWCCSNCVILSETNGVGGHITSAKLVFVYKNKEYESYTFEGRTFKPYESWKVCDTICTVYEYDQIKITVKGTDNNNYSINVSKYFNIYYE